MLPGYMHQTPLAKGKRRRARANCFGSELLGRAQTFLPKLSPKDQRPSVETNMAFAKQLLSRSLLMQLPYLQCFANTQMPDLVVVLTILNGADAMGQKCVTNTCGHQGIYRLYLPSLARYTVKDVSGAPMEIRRS